ncbi:hypothetical protein [Deinococcus kurensis]|uniref:hypothetical protein n=1 Tax=Deinococcus kurensis TaxID=2662757 RepID=UPI0012D34EE2|nr:hypothetical protein [Deinococcus kurensis]
MSHPNPIPHAHTASSVRRTVLHPTHAYNYATRLLSSMAVGSAYGAQLTGLPAAHPRLLSACPVRVDADPAAHHVVMPGQFGATTMVALVTLEAVACSVALGESEVSPRQLSQSLEEWLALDDTRGLGQQATIAVQCVGAALVAGLYGAFRPLADAEAIPTTVAHILGAQLSRVDAADLRAVTRMVRAMLLEPAAEDATLLRERCKVLATLIETGEVQLAARTLPDEPVMRAVVQGAIGAHMQSRSMNIDASVKAVVNLGGDTEAAMTAFGFIVGSLPLRYPQQLADRWPHIRQQSRWMDLDEPERLYVDHIAVDMFTASLLRTKDRWMLN